MIQRQTKTFSVPANDGYQILPRDSFDIIQTGPISLISSVVQSNITTTSFDLSWSVSDYSTATLKEKTCIKAAWQVLWGN